MIYQELNLAPHLTVEENIMLGREAAPAGFLGRGPRPAGGSARRWPSSAIPRSRPDVPVRRLSVGARQIVEIARALLDKARILVMDEPTSSLTQEDTERLFQIIRRLKGEGVSIIYISHFLEEVQAVADAYTVLRDGRNVGTGPHGRDVRSRRSSSSWSASPSTELFPRVAHRAGRGRPVAVRGLKGGADGRARRRWSFAGARSSAWPA